MQIFQSREPRLLSAQFGDGHAMNLVAVGEIERGQGVMDLLGPAGNKHGATEIAVGAPRQAAERDANA